MIISPLSEHPGLWRIAAKTNGYLFVRNGESLLIDCPVQEIAPTLYAARLPMPRVVLHTQVQEEHCREWAAAPQAKVYVAAASTDIARRAPQYFADCATVWPPSREWDTRGEEPYGIAGCTTERPPVQPLNVVGVLQPGETFTWQDIEFEVLALPGSGKRAIGLFWRTMGVLFSGDLLHAGGYLVNFFDIERSYGNLTGYAELHDSLQVVAQLAPALLLPSTGPNIDAPLADIATLQDRLAVLENMPSREPHDPHAGQITPQRKLGRYREVIPGVMQSSNFGNVILFIDAEGRGMMADPDPCIWLPTWEENCQAIHADLDLFEREAGLRTIELALLTHYHGDHVQFCDLLRQRYDTTICATPDVAAVLEQPQSFPYPCTLDWYGFPFQTLHIDRRLQYEEAFAWHDVAVTPVHTPGHCFAHTGFLLTWNGLRITCTGDTLQYRGGPLAAALPVIYNDTAWPLRGERVTYQRLRAWQPELALGGHGSGFYDRDGRMLDDLIAVAGEGERVLAGLIHDGDLLRAMTPPGYDEVRRRMLAATTPASAR